MITRTDIAAHLDRAVRVGFLNSQEKYAVLRNAFVREVPSEAAFERYASMGDTPWPQKNEGQQGAQGQSPDGHSEVSAALGGGQGITIIGANERGEIIYNVDWEISMGIEHNAIDDDQTGELLQWAEGTGDAFEKHKDYLSFNALNAGESATPYGKAYDGLSFFNDSHLDPRALYQTTQDNRFLVALSMDNFETVRVAGQNLLDDRGNPGGFMHNLLITGPGLTRMGSNIATNPTDPSTANRANNPYANKVTHLEAPGGWLDSTAWHLLDVSKSFKPINLQNRKNPELQIWDDYKAKAGGVRYYRWHARYNVFYGNWRTAMQGNS